MQHFSKFCMTNSSFTVSRSCLSPALSRELDWQVSEQPCQYTLASVMQTLNIQFPLSWPELGARG